MVSAVLMVAARLIKQLHLLPAVLGSLLGWTDVLFANSLCVEEAHALFAEQPGCGLAAGVCERDGICWDDTISYRVDESVQGNVSDC